MRAHHKRNLWFGEPDLSCRFHRGGPGLVSMFSRLLVASCPALDLLPCAKHLSFAATVPRTDAVQALLREEPVRRFLFDGLLGHCGCRLAVHYLLGNANEPGEVALPMDLPLAS